MNNRRIIPILFVLLLVTSGMQLHAQEKNNQIKTSLVMPLGRVFQLSYERMLNSDMSLEMAIGIGTVFYVNPQFRYYLSETQQAPTGVFISPYALVGDEMAGGGLTVGYQRLFKQKVSLEAFLGPLIAEDISVWGGINVGIAF